MIQPARPSDDELVRVAEGLSSSGNTLPLPSDLSINTGWARRLTPRSQENRDRIPMVASSRHVAFPGICRTTQGRLLVVYRDGLTHAGGKQPTDGRIMMVESLDDGRSWSKPWLVYDDPSVDDRNSALMCATDGTIVLVWNKYLEGEDLGVFLATSKDEGQTWSPPARIGSSPFLRTRSSPVEIQAPNGESEWLIPMYDCISDEKAAYVGIFHPQDGTSEVYPVTAVGERNVSDEWALAQAADGRLVALIRSNWDPFLWQSESRDCGRTWQEAWPSNIPSQSTPPDLIRLHDGRLLVTFSFRERCNERQAISADHGESWQVVSSIDVFDATLRGDRSYPAATQIDEQTVGTVLYETMPAPQGGIIWFARTRLNDLKRPGVETWCSPRSEDDVMALLPFPDRSPATYQVTVDYRFVGEFDPKPSGIEIVLRDENDRCLHAGYWLGGGLQDTNYIQITFADGLEERVMLRQGAVGDLYNDGNDHRIALVYRPSAVVLAIDGTMEAVVQLPDQFAGFAPKLGGISACNAALALYGLEVGCQ